MPLLRAASSELSCASSQAMHVSRVTPWRVVVAAAYAAGQMPLSRDEIAAAWAAARREPKRKAPANAFAETRHEWYHSRNHDRNPKRPCVTDACLDAALAKIMKCWAPFSHRPVNRRPALARRVVAAGAVEVPAALSADDVAALTALADCVARWGTDRKPAERPFHDHSGASLVWALGWYLQRVAPELTERLYAIAAFAAAGHFAVDPGSPPALGLPRAPRPDRGVDVRAGRCASARRSASSTRSAGGWTCIATRIRPTR